MNWTYLHHSRAALIRLLTETEDNEHLRFETLRYTLRDNILWSVVRITTKNETATSGAGATVTLLQCYELCQAEKKWGYRALSESVGLLHYTCPLCYLRLAPERSAFWREQVLRCHQATASR